MASIKETVVGTTLVCLIGQSVMSGLFFQIYLYLLAGSGLTRQMEWLTVHSLGLSLLIRANLMSSCQLRELTAVRHFLVA